MAEPVLVEPSTYCVWFFDLIWSLFFGENFVKSLSVDYCFVLKISMVSKHLGESNHVSWDGEKSGTSGWIDLMVVWEDELIRVGVSGGAEWCLV